LAAVDDVGGQAALTRAGLMAYDVLVLERDLPVVDVGAVLDAAGVTALVDRGFRGMAKARARWHAPIGDRRTKDQRTSAERDHNRLLAGLRALVEQAIGQLANAWTLRRWRGLLNRVRDLDRAAAALICLGRWIHRIPT
jgi:DDE superfamily endonuclease